MRGNYVLGDLVSYWRAGIGVHQAQGQCLGPARVYQVCKRTATYGVTRRARNARDADEDWRRRP